MKLLIITQSVFQGILAALIFTIFPIVVFTLVTTKTTLIPDFRSFVVLTGSMSPLIPTGSIVYTHRSDIYNVGEIITFNRGDITVTHRIIDIKKENGKVFYKTKGDANMGADSQLVAANMLVGKALFHFPLVGYFVSFLRTPIGFGIFLIFPTILFIFSEFWKIKQELVQIYKKKSYD